MNNRLIIASASAGAGHVQAARAVLAEYERRQYPAPAEHIDTLETGSRTFKRTYTGAYDFMVSHIPDLYGFFYHLTDRKPGPVQKAWDVVRQRDEYIRLRRFRRHVMQSRPVWVLNTHFLSPPAIGRMIEHGTGDLRQAVVVTDYDSHRWWVSPHVDFYCVASQKAADRLMTFGVSADRIVETGIPIDPKWYDLPTRHQARQDWSLDQDRPAVLILGGTNFAVAGFERLIGHLAMSLPDVQVVALTGRNTRMHKRLAARRTEAPNLVPVAFTTRIHELVAAADVLVAKPGGLISTEAITAGCPLVTVGAIPGQEELNQEHLCASAVAVAADILRPTQVVSTVRTLLGNPARLAAMRDATRALRRTGAKSIVDQVAAWMGL